MEERREQVLTPSAGAAACRGRRHAGSRWRGTVAQDHGDSELVLNPLLHLQPMQLLQKQRHGILLLQRKHETSSGIQRGLQSADGVGWNTC